MRQIINYYICWQFPKRLGPQIRNQDGNQVFEVLESKTLGRASKLLGKSQHLALLYSMKNSVTVYLLHFHCHHPLFLTKSVLFLESIIKFFHSFYSIPFHSSSRILQTSTSFQQKLKTDFLGGLTFIYHKYLLSPQMGPNSTQSVYIKHYLRFGEVQSRPAQR